jgi:hypothetical protein
MFTRNARPLLALAMLLFAGTIGGCQRQPDPEEYGEIITEVPRDLDKPFPLPELDAKPADGPPSGVSEKPAEEAPK